MRIIIIGGGPKGLGAAYRLNELGHADFALYEKNAWLGGLSASYYEREGFTWDFAIHVLHSHYRYFDRLMEEVFPEGFHTHARKSWIWEHGCFVPYPFQNNLRYLPGNVVWDCVRGLLERDRLTSIDAGNIRRMGPVGLWGGHCQPLFASV